MKNISIFPENVEGTLEILDGKMIFNDYENDRKVCLNFTYDEIKKRRTVDVTTLYYSDFFTLYDFNNDGSTFSRFEPGKDYSGFKTKYNSDPDSAISENTQKIKVRNGGTYVVDALCYDENNNIFAGRANSEINVIAPDVCLTTYIYDASSNNEYNRSGKAVDSSTVSILTSLYNDYAIFKYKEKYHIKESKRSIDFNVDTHPYEYFSGDEGDYASISNLVDKFNVIGADGSVLVLKRDSLGDGAIMMDSGDLISSCRYEFNETPNLCAKDLLTKFNRVDASQGSCADVTVTLYNESGEFPVVIYPAKLINVTEIDSSYGYDNNEYRLAFDSSVITDSDFKTIMNNIKLPNISLYIQPTWAFEFYVENVYKENEYFETELNKSFPFSRTFQKNDISKVTFGSSLSETEKYGQCAYNILTHTSKNNIKLNGIINDKYAIGNYHFDYVELKQTTPTILFDVSTDIDGNDYLWSLVDEEFVTYKDSSNDCQIPAIRGEESPTSLTVYYAPCTYETIQDIYKRLGYAFPVSSFNDNEEAIKTSINYISHGHGMYTRYIGKVSDSDLGGSTNTISLVNDYDNNRNKDYIDRTFNISLRDFNVAESQSYWKDGKPSVFAGELMEYHCPVSTEYGMFVMKPDLMPVIGYDSSNYDNSELTTIWRIYEHNPGADSRNMIMECFNGAIYINTQKGKSYDAELTMYDKYGNKYDKTFIGAVNGEDDIEKEIKVKTNYLTFSTDGESVISGAYEGDDAPALFISRDTVNWTQWEMPYCSEEAITKDNPLYVRGKNNSTLNEFRFKIGDYNDLVECTGNIMCLLDYENLGTTITTNECFSYLFYNCSKLKTAPELPATTLTAGCYESMFKGCASLVNAPALPATTLDTYCYYAMFSRCTSLKTAPELPAKTLTNGCYAGMFNGCTSLVNAPALPATTLADECYTLYGDMFHTGMFEGCTSLVNAPALPATTLTRYCYSEMFSGCTSLKTAPALPATVLTKNCYGGMFYNCKSLTTAPKLPATTLADYCYGYWKSDDSLYSHGMFEGCTSLTTAPVLDASILTSNCYNRMFSGCTSLNYVKCLATTNIDTNDSTSDWLSNVSSTGTFIKKSGVTWPTGDSGIPSGWNEVV